MSDRLTLIAARRVLIAAGYTTPEIANLVRGIKADSWDSGADWHMRASGVDRVQRLTLDSANPYRRWGA